MTVMNYAFWGVCGVSLVQALAIALLLRRRSGRELSRVETRLSHFGEALALLTDTAQTGFATIAAELERGGRRRAAGAGRAATSKRIVTAAHQGRSIQDIAADEAVSESEVRLHLGLAEERVVQPAVAHDTPVKKSRGSRRRPTAPRKGA